MILLAIDRGNSRTKVCLRNTTGDFDIKIFANAAEKDILPYIQQLSFDAAVMSSVVAVYLTPIAEYLQTREKFLFVDSSTPLPIKNIYATPDTLGADRIAGAVGAWTIAQRKDVLLADAGTCINYECVVNNTYMGGAISPGLQMRLKAMHEYTGKLPSLNLPETEIELIGNSTATCMLSGAVQGMVHEMKGIAAEYQLKFPGIMLVLSGGDAAYLGKYLKNSIFAPHKEVVLLGLIEILKYNLDA